MNKNYVAKYIDELNNAVQNAEHIESDTNDIYLIIRRCLHVLGNELGFDESVFMWKKSFAVEDARLLIEKLEYLIAESNESQNNKSSKNKSMIFLSHKSDDKKYGDALRDFIIGLGLDDNQLIYTSHPLHKIPLDANIYDYLRNNINTDIFMIILWSNKYLESPACLNEMGAAWVVQSDYTNIYVPDFSFGNPKYHECAVNTRKMGAVLNGDDHCKANLLELKNKIVKMFNLNVDEAKTTYLIDEFIKKIV